MAITLDLPPELERRLAEAADRRHIGVGDYLREIVSQAVTGSARAPLWATGTKEERIRAFREWAESHRNLPELPPDAYTREGMYGHRA